MFGKKKKTKKEKKPRVKFRTRLWFWMERRISLRRLDSVNRFWIQTRLLFSKTILLLLVAIFVFFAWVTIEKELYKEEAFYYLLLGQSVFLAVLLHMSLWEHEREGKTFELLAMRVPTTGQLIWFKLRVSLTWSFFLSMPFCAGFTWFLSIPLHRVAVYLVFFQTVAVISALFTCVVSSFVHRGLPTGIVVIIVIWMIAGFTEGAPLPYKSYYQPFINPFGEKLDALTLFEKIRLLTVNRVVMVGVLVCMYWWLHQRLRKLEKWIA